MKKLGRLISVIALVAGTLASPARAQWDVQIERGAIDVPRGTLVIQNLDAVWTATGEVLENVSIVVRDGIIREIGTDVSIPRDAEVIDGTGLTAIPGIIDEHAHTAMDRATNEGTTPVSAEVRVVDALDPTSYDIYRALSGGVTTSLIMHGSANPIGGQTAVIKMRWGMDDPEQLLFEGAPLMIKFALGENVTGKNWSPEGRARFPRSRAGVESFYDQVFTAALEYKQAWDQYNANRRAYPVPPRRDLRLETVVGVLEGRILVRCHSYRSDEIVMLMRVAERYGFRIDNFTHVLEGYKVADELAEHGASAGTFSDWWAYKLEAYDAIPHNAAIMHEHGVLTMLNSDGPTIQPFMVYEFNKPVKYGGVSREDALRMLTLYAAQSLHIDDRVGSIEVGKEADIALLNGDPFSTYSRVEKTIVDGIVYFDLSREAETRGAPIRALPVVSPPPVTAAPSAAMAASAGTDGSNGSQATLALVGATVHPVSGPEIADAVVMIADDRISYVGPRAGADIPAAAEVINVAGKHIYPGMIDPITRIGMIEVGQVAASRDDQETGRYNPHVNALWGVHPHSVEINVTRANGITAVLSVPGSGVIQGAGAVIQLSGDTSERMAIAERAALVIDIPSPSGKAWEDPKLEGERLEELVDLFERAVAYAAAPSHNDDPTAPFDGNDRMRERAMLEAMVPAVTGEMPVFFAAASERDIKTLFMFLDKFPEVEPVLLGGDQAFRVADEMAERGIPVIIASALSRTSDRAEPVSANYANAGILHAAGVKVAFGTGDYANVRNLPYHAAKAVAFGLPQEVGLRAVTLNTAEILGLGSEMGSIEVGKRADLIVTDGDPLQIVTNVERAFINGVEVSLGDNKHTRLYERFKDRH
ncbi:MAG: amidohydrolase family protein [Gemmatimonadetes bacterium]|nr:amidohydrolase family protein [Gemmatimonadota bacterium]NIO32995.1 amidohydrolase family protein [Gemmatimonadota bacterium]